MIRNGGRIAVGMGRVPGPAAPDNLFEPGIVRLPAQLPSDLIAGRHEYRWIPGAAVHDLRRNLNPGNLPGRIDDVEDRMPRPGRYSPKRRLRVESEVPPDWRISPSAFTKLKKLLREIGPSYH
jgi:hypothetical protein